MGTVISDNILPRDREQTHRLHEPTHIDGSFDPMTGQDIIDRAGHPHVDEGNLTIYFESEQTRQAYLDMPLTHPARKVPGAPSADADRGG